jgi:hypothetical protein
VEATHIERDENNKKMDIRDFEYKLMHNLDELQL